MNGGRERRGLADAAALAGHSAGARAGWNGNQSVFAVDPHHWPARQGLPVWLAGCCVADRPLCLIFSFPCVHPLSLLLPSMATFLLRSVKKVYVASYPGGRGEERQGQKGRRDYGRASLYPACACPKSRSV
ncbi:hypothetical protein BRADI_1g27185v3 [Brachypodium distachyon]|uniref:Uncharacterized protein n=1 Tax=Brachypodium distachyon TaxID=15368 RepID=A0A0Q3GZ71_BRADI|nr:hypothetical protein BRADI_1g27185v3 [Brachypodium distachyon]